VNYGSLLASEEVHHEEAKFTSQIQNRSRGTEILGDARLHRLHRLEPHDSTDYIDWSKAERARFPNLKPSTTAISIRLPLGLLEQIKIAANKRDVPYQSLIKMWLAEKVG
jgi:predicted DNA binding CopG/RHH family protein